MSTDKATDTPPQAPAVGSPRFSEGLGVTACTQWFRHDRMKGWEFNHLEDGHATGDKPKPRFPSQAGWLRASWQRYHCWLTASVPPKVTFVGPQDL